MNFSRKEFIRHGFMTMGKTVLECANVMKSVQSQDSTQDETMLHTGDTLLATVCNERCLARSCGCFVCSDACRNGAVSIVPGLGTVVDEDSCTGCGECQAICPVFPKAIVLVTRKSIIF